MHVENIFKLYFTEGSGYFHIAFAGYIEGLSSYSIYFGLATQYYLTHGVSVADNMFGGATVYIPIAVGWPRTVICQIELRYVCCEFRLRI